MGGKWENKKKRKMGKNMSIICQGLFIRPKRLHNNVKLRFPAVKLLQGHYLLKQIVQSYRYHAVTSFTLSITFGCSRSPSFTCSAVPFPARARPSTRAVEAPEPMPNVKHLPHQHQR